MTRNDVAPIWTRKFPISKQPQTIGEHLRKRRFDLRLRQAQAAEQLGVSTRTLGLWETDIIFPTWPYQSKLIEYFGYDPFTEPRLGRPGGNESRSVAVLSQVTPQNIGQEILKRRLDMKKNRKRLARELGIGVKTLWGWETNRWQPSPSLKVRILEFLGMRE